MLFYLVSTLNAVFNPDYDFSNAKSDEFSREPSVEVSRVSIEVSGVSIEVSGVSIEVSGERRGEW